MISKTKYKEIKKRWEKSSPGEWKAFVEGRDHTSGCSFIRTGSGQTKQTDIEMSGATVEDYDFIANAKQDIAFLLELLETNGLLEDN